MYKKILGQPQHHIQIDFSTMKVLSNHFGVHCITGVPNPYV